MPAKSESDQSKGLLNTELEVGNRPRCSRIAPAATSNPRTCAASSRACPCPTLKGDEDEESNAAETAQAEPDEEDDEGDFLLEESARVLADYISLSERQISAVSDF